jgi:hypothetical protein
MTFRDSRVEAFREFETALRDAASAVDLFNIAWAAGYDAHEGKED